MEFRRVLFRSDRKSTRLNSSHTLISYVVLSLDRKSTRLNSSHTLISYAVFCLTKKRRRTSSPRSPAPDATQLSGCGGRRRFRGIPTTFFFKDYGDPGDLHSFPTRPPSN